MGNRKDLKADVGTKLAQVTIYRTKNKRKKKGKVRLGLSAESGFVCAALFVWVYYTRCKNRYAKNGTVTSISA